MITKATVLLSVEVEASGTWGPECSMEQIIRQAYESAIGQIRNSLTRYRIVGDPAVTTITNAAEAWEVRDARKDGAA